MIACKMPLLENDGIHCCRDYMDKQSSLLARASILVLTKSWGELYAFSILIFSYQLVRGSTHQTKCIFYKRPFLESEYT